LLCALLEADKKERFSCTSPEKKIEIQERIYNQHVRLLSPEPWLVGTTKVYSGLGADIVMESLRSKPLNEHNRLWLLKNYF
jgi:hypothetical protein